jgi:hypothetical protein
MGSYNMDDLISRPGTGDTSNSGGANRYNRENALITR